MFYSDEQTVVAIDIIHMVETAVKEKKPLPKPEDVIKWEKDAAAGNEEAWIIKKHMKNMSGLQDWAVILKDG